MQPIQPLSITEIQQLAETIRLVVGRAIRSGHWPRQERADLEQALWVKALKRRPAYEPTRASWSTFVQRLLLGEIQHRIRDRYAAKRHPQRIQADTNPELVSAPTTDDDLALSIRELLAQAPPRTRQLASALLDGATLPAARRQLGLTAQETEDLLGELRWRFVRGGLADDFPLMRH